SAHGVRPVEHGGRTADDLHSLQIIHFKGILAIGGRAGCVNIVAANPIDNRQHTVASNAADHEPLVATAAGGVHADAGLEAGDVIEVVGQLLLDLLGTDDGNGASNVIQWAGEIGGGDGDFFDLALACLGNGARYQAAADAYGNAECETVQGKRGAAGGVGWHDDFSGMGQGAPSIMNFRIIRGHALIVNRNHSYSHLGRRRGRVTRWSENWNI